MLRKSGVLALVAVACTGCANLTTYNKERTTGDKSKIYFVDAKQRAIFSSTHTIKPVADKSGRMTAEEEIQRFCAEPSPDALSAIAASLGINLSVPGQGDVGINHAITETAASIGIRTSAIQALRDITYRNCEGYVNGGITSFGLETLQRRFQSTLVAVLAIEQLTGAVQARNVALTSSLSKSDAASLAKIVDQVTEAKAALDAAKSAQAKADAKVKTAKDAVTALIAQKEANVATEAKKPADRTEPEKTALAGNDDLVKNKIPAAQADLDAATKDQLIKTKAVEDRQADYDAALKIRTFATEGGGSLATAALFAPGDMPKPMDKESVIAVSAAVTQIVDSTLRLGFGREACTTLFGKLLAVGLANDAGVADSLQGTCIAFLKGDATLLENQAGQIKAQTESLKQWMPIIQKLATDGKLTSDQALQYFTVMFGLPSVISKEDSKSGGTLPTSLSKVGPMSTDFPGMGILNKRGTGQNILKVPKVME